MTTSLKAIFTMLALTPLPAQAWGIRGHAAIAAIAEAQLDPAVRRTVAILLASEGKAHLYDVSSWADRIKKERRKGFSSHTTRMALQGDADVERACARHYCSLNGLRRFYRILRDPRQSVAKREEALKMVVHLVGDIHEPLHNVVVTGSKIDVMFKGERTSLHKAWDTLMLREHGSGVQIAAGILRTVPKTPEADKAVNWVLESRQVALASIFNDVAPRGGGVIVLPADYSRRKWPIIALQLRRAGDRLAYLLNRALAAG